MSNVRRVKGWELAESLVTDEALYLDRRRFLRASTTLCASASLGLLGCASGRPHERDALTPEALDTPDPASLGPVEFGIEHPDAFYPEAARNAAFAVPAGRVLATHQTAASYNNFYEFTSAKKSVWKKVGAFQTRPWTVEIGGLVHKPMTLDIDDILRRMPHEERIYRHRCVEAWTMVVPWSGFPMKALFDLVQPLGTAKFVKFYSAGRPAQMPRLKASTWYPWPYHEALRMDEASNDLAMLVTGLYGKSLPRQNGAPLRLVVPWKYGYKSIKSIVKIEFVAEQPTTFWHTLEPEEYSFLSNVEPTIPHPRWSQAIERDIQTDQKHETTRFNGYGEFVSSLYSA